MGSIRIAFTLLREPRIFFSLMLAPLVFSVYIAIVEVTLVGFLISTFLPSGDDELNFSFEKARSQNWSWRYLHGKNVMTIDPIRICRENATDPNEICRNDAITVALRVDDPLNHEPSNSLVYFDGLVPQLKLCRACNGDVVFTPTPPASIIAQTLSGFAILHLSSLQRDFYERRRSLIKDYLKFKAPLGAEYVFPQGFRVPLSVHGAVLVLSITFNICFLVAMGIFVSLWSHRRVLNYFASNQVLMPLVVSCGSAVFYRAIWVLTLLRATIFFIAALPISVIGLALVIGDHSIPSFFSGDGFEFGVWLFALVFECFAFSLFLSVAELRHRRGFQSLVFRYIPILLVVFSFGVWCASLWLPNDLGHLIRNFLAALPILGMPSLIAAPISTEAPLLFLLQAILALLLGVYLLQRNTRWFSAHLEEL